MNLEKHRNKTIDQIFEISYWDEDQRLELLRMVSDNSNLETCRSQLKEFLESVKESKKINVLSFTSCLNNFHSALLQFDRLIASMRKWAAQEVEKAL